MSYQITVFCRTGGAATRATIADFVQRGAFFTAAPRFVPAPERPDFAAHDWDTLEIHYDTVRPPMCVVRTSAPERMRPAVEEAVAMLAATADDGVAAVAEAVHAAQEMYAIAIEPLDTVEAAWKMLDAMGAFMAGAGAGVIYAQDDGFYDAQLAALVRL